MSERASDVEFCRLVAAPLLLPFGRAFLLRFGLDYLMVSLVTSGYSAASMFGVRCVVVFMRRHHGGAVLFGS